MSTGDDDDLKLQRASASLLFDFAQLLPRLLRKRNHGAVSSQLRQRVREGDLNKACSLVRALDTELVQLSLIRH